MRRERWLGLCTAVVFALGAVAVAGDHGQGHGKHHGDDDDQGRYYYSDHNRDDARNWYHDHDQDGLPPGLAKRDRLPPGLEKQLRVRGTLPPGLRKKMYPCPEEIERRLPPPPPGCEHTVIGGHIVLVNRSTYVVLDIIHFER